MNAVAGERGAVAAGHPTVVAAGLEALRSGGNAIDAVVAAAFTACVVEPVSCGLAGYGHLSMYLADGRGFVTVDHGPRAPARAHADMFALSQVTVGDYEWPEVAGRRNEVGGLAPAVPGAVAGLGHAHDLACRLPLPQLLEPAIRAADRGVEVSWDVLLAITARLDDIRDHAASAAFLLTDGDPPTIDPYWRPTRVLDTTALAATLRAIAAHGAGAFHGGQVARQIEATANRAGGILTAKDLADYRPKVIREQPATYRDTEYVTANDQVGYEVLNILDQLPVSHCDPASAGFYHLMAEAFGHAFVDNATWYGDTDHVRSPLGGLASREFAATRAAVISPDRASPRPIPPADPWPFDSSARPDTRTPPVSVAGTPGTTQVAAVDAAGNLASLITTVGHDFGSVVYVEEVGCFLNSSMVNFDPRPGRPNSIAPGKMPFFAVPAIVAAKDGRGCFAAGGSGGYRILSSVVHAFVHSVDFALPVTDAVTAPRVYCQGGDLHIDDRIPASVRRDLETLGHTLVVEHTGPGSEPFARVSATTRTDVTGRVLCAAASDPPWHSSAGVC